MEKFDMEKFLKGLGKYGVQEDGKDMEEIKEIEKDVENKQPRNE